MVSQPPTPVGRASAGDGLILYLSSENGLFKTTYSNARIND
jgi:hypothetical protein